MVVGEVEQDTSIKVLIYGKSVGTIDSEREKESHIDTVKSTNTYISYIHR